MAVASHPHGGRVATGGIDGNVRFWEPGTGREVTAFAGHRSWVNAVAYSPNGLALASASSDATVIVWDVPGRKERHTLRPKAAEIRSGTFSPDGTLLAAGTRDGGEKERDAASGDEDAAVT